MRPIDEIVRTVPPLDRTAMAAARARQQQLTKPLGSLGRLEELAVRLAGMTGQPRPRCPRKAVILLAADHGVAAEGVSAYPQAVTAQMVQAFLAGRAAISVLARQTGARVVVADLGVATDLPAHPDLLSRKIGHGTKNMAVGPAMSRDEALAAIEAGRDITDAEIRAGLDLVATGEMGIGNTTAASAIVAAVTGRPVAAVTGRGTGLDDRGWAHKVRVIERALTINRPEPTDAIDVLAKVGGYEIGGLVGVILAAAACRCPVVIDGFITGAAALLASLLCPDVRDYLIASHRSLEAGHQAILEWLELKPLFDLDLRLGEGSGAALAMHLIDDATALHDEMATFAEAGVSTASAPSVAAEAGPASGTGPACPLPGP